METLIEKLLARAGPRLLLHSVGPGQGSEVFTLQDVPVPLENPDVLLLVVGVLYFIADAGTVEPEQELVFIAVLDGFFGSRFLVCV